MRSLSPQADLVNWVSSENDTILPYVDDLSSSDESFEDTAAAAEPGDSADGKGVKETRKIRRKKDPKTGARRHAVVAVVLNSAARAQAAAGGGVGSGRWRKPHVLATRPRCCSCPYGRPTRLALASNKQDR